MSTVSNADDLITPAETATILAVKPSTLAARRCYGTSPIPFYKIGRSVRYRRGDVLAYRDRCRHDQEGSGAA